MTELTYGPIVRVGVDLSKHFYQVHAVDQWDHLVLAKSLSPERFYAWLRHFAARLPGGHRSLRRLAPCGQAIASAGPGCTADRSTLCHALSDDR